MDIIIPILFWIIPGAVSATAAFYFIDKVDVTLGHILFGCAMGWLMVFLYVVYFILHYVPMIFSNPLKIIIFKRKGKER